MASRSVMAVAHRGASAYAPENTLAAFKEALRLGSPAIEFDVRVTSDGVPVVLHDETVERTTNGRGPVWRRTRAELMTLDAGSWMGPSFAEERIPTVEEALAVIAPTAMPIVELKVPVDPAVLGPLLEQHKALGTAAIISFEPRLLAPFRKGYRDLAIGLLADSWYDDLPMRAKAAGAGILGMNVDILTLPRVEAAEAQGLEVWTYTANDIGLVAACAAMGVRGIITDRPDLIRHQRREAP